MCGFGATNKYVSNQVSQELLSLPSAFLYLKICFDALAPSWKGSTWPWKACLHSCTQRFSLPSVAYLWMDHGLGRLFVLPQPLVLSYTEPQEFLSAELSNTATPCHFSASSCKEGQLRVESSGGTGNHASLRLVCPCAQQLSRFFSSKTPQDLVPPGHRFGCNVLF